MQIEELMIFQWIITPIAIFWLLGEELLSLPDWSIQHVLLFFNCCREYTEEKPKEVLKQCYLIMCLFCYLKDGRRCVMELMVDIDLQRSTFPKLSPSACPFKCFQLLSCQWQLSSVLVTWMLRCSAAVKSNFPVLVKF